MLFHCSKTSESDTRKKASGKTVSDAASQEDAIILETPAMTIFIIQKLQIIFGQLLQVLTQQPSFRFYLHIVSL